jgi:hypothetical protein
VETTSQPSCAASTTIHVAKGIFFDMTPAPFGR